MWILKEIVANSDQSSAGRRDLRLRQLSQCGELAQLTLGHGATFTVSLEEAGGARGRSSGGSHDGSLSCAAMNWVNHSRQTKEDECVWNHNRVGSGDVKSLCPAAVAFYDDSLSWRDWMLDSYSGKSMYSTGRRAMNMRGDRGDG